MADPGAPYYKLGYIPDDHAIPGTEYGQMACSYTLEQSYNDHCAATMAKDLGTKEDYEAYTQRSRSWQNLWNPAAKYKEFSSFICPRNSDGTWVEIDPGQHWVSWVKHFYEATSYNYSFFVPHDVPALIEKCGGEDAFIRRLTHGIETGLVDHGNEPAFLASHLFAYTKKPWLINDNIDKLRYLFTMDGPPGKEIVIRANNLCKENKYIQAVRINGQEWHSTMFTHEMIRDGAVYEFDMDAEAVDYTKGE